LRRDKGRAGQHATDFGRKNQALPGSARPR
jgi:hypothetical protein